jgi:hypothetical protein
MKKGQTHIGSKLRNILTDDFLKALNEVWKEEGIGAIRNMFRDNPTKACILVANLLPKEFDIMVENKLQEVSDDELERLIETVRERRSAFTNIERREDETLN